MNSTLLYNLFRFIGLLILQILLFDNINLYGVATPYPYILFILLFPIYENKKWLYLSSFALGLCLDIFNNSGGVHAFAALMLAGAKDSFLKISYGISFEQHNIKIAEKINKELISYLVLSIIFHHLILFSLEIFSIHLIIEILIKSFASALFTFIFILLLIALTKPSKR